MATTDDADCPEFLKPRLRLFLSADIIGSTALKQSRLGAMDQAEGQSHGSWFTTIQGFYFEAQQSFLAEWRACPGHDRDPAHFGEPPRLWKTIGDEVLFTKLITDHRQVAVTLQCWVRTLDRIRAFLTRDSVRLGVKSTAWLAGFPFRNKEVVLSGDSFSGDAPIDDYFKENGRLLNKYYGSDGSNIVIDYVGPSIDTGFRLTTLASARKLILSLEVAYIMALTSTISDSPIRTINLRYDGQAALKGVLGGSGYPVFWLDLGAGSSAAVLEDKLTSGAPCDRDAARRFCEAFIAEQELMFLPFVASDTESVLTKRPAWYAHSHANLIKNFNAALDDAPAEPEDRADDPDFRAKQAGFEQTIDALFAARGVAGGGDAGR